LRKDAKVQIDSKNYLFFKSKIRLKSSFNHQDDGNDTRSKLKRIKGQGKEKEPEMTPMKLNE